MSINMDAVGAVGHSAPIVESGSPVAPARTESTLPEESRLDRLKLRRLVLQANSRLQRHPRTRSMEFVPIEIAGKTLIQLQKGGRVLHEYPLERILRSGALLKEVGMVYRTKA
jgi:hypothetical protein